jgi:hypothetical protein
MLISKTHEQLKSIEGLLIEKANFLGIFLLKSLSR